LALASSRISKLRSKATENAAMFFNSRSFSYSVDEPTLTDDEGFEWFCSGEE